MFIEIEICKGKKEQKIMLNLDRITYISEEKDVTCLWFDNNEESAQTFLVFDEFVKIVETAKLNNFYLTHIMGYTRIDDKKNSNIEKVLDRGSIEDKLELLSDLLGEKNNRVRVKKRVLLNLNKVMGVVEDDDTIGIKMHESSSLGGTDTYAQFKEMLKETNRLGSVIPGE